MTENTPGASPSLTRPFYHDPLPAGRMAKHFGMRSENLDACGQYVQFGLESGFVAVAKYLDPFRAYVHLDSLALLEPNPETDMTLHGILKAVRDTDDIPEPNRIIERNGIATVELAEQIKALRASHAVEAAPTRIKPQKAEAAKPRRREAVEVPTEAPTERSTDPPSPPPAEDDTPLPASTVSFRQRVVKPVQRSLF